MTLFAGRQDEFFAALMRVDARAAEEIFEQALSADRSFANVEDLIVGSLERIGDGWEGGEVSLSQVYMAGLICERLVTSILPDSVPIGDSYPRIGIVNLQDRHSLGKSIVFSFVKAQGWQIEDFGSGLTVSEVVEKVLEAELDFLLVSVLMLESAKQVRRLVRELRATGSKTLVIVGGAPFRLDGSLWQEVEADACGNTAFDAVRIIRTLGEGKGS